MYIQYARGYECVIVCRRCEYQYGYMCCLLLLFFTKRACPILIICMDKETYSYLYTCMRGGDFVFGFLKEGFDGACNDGLCTVFITY